MLVALNTRLAAEEVRSICMHSGARLLVADASLARHGGAGGRPPRGVREIVWAGERAAAAPPGSPTRSCSERGSDDPLPWAVEDEDATISINYTSGTTGEPRA